MARDLQRHLCSLTVLAHRYRRFRQNLRSVHLEYAYQAVLRSSGEVQSDMGVLSGRIFEIGGTLSCRVEEVEHRSYLPLLLGETFEVERFLRQLLSAEKRLEQMLVHTVGLATRNADQRTADLARRLAENSNFRRRRLGGVGEDVH